VACCRRLGLWRRWRRRSDSRGGLSVRAPQARNSRFAVGTLANSAIWPSFPARISSGLIEAQTPMKACFGYNPFPISYAEAHRRWRRSSLASTCQRRAAAWTAKTSIWAGNAADQEGRFTNRSRIINHHHDNNSPPRPYVMCWRMRHLGAAIGAHGRDGFGMGVVGLRLSGIVGSL